MSNQTEYLRDLFDRRGVVRLIGAHNALGARLAERAGFDGVWSSGLEISTSYALPDANILSMAEYLAAAESMANAVNIPIVADCDTGYGNSNNVIHMVRKYEAAGVAAVCMEDKLFPKVNSFVPGRQDLASVAEFVGKIMAAKNAQRDPNFMVIARTEALVAGWGQEEAMKRARAYARAGADAILMHNKDRSVEPIREFMRNWDSPVPVVVVPTTYYEVTAAELAGMGVKMVIYANHGLRAAIRAMEETYQEILEAGTTAPVEPRLETMKTVFHLQGMDTMKKDEAIYLRDREADTRAVILAAGDHLQSRSMEAITQDIPIAMLDVNGKPLLERQVETLNISGIRNVTVVTGYRGEAIEVEGAEKVQNAEWETTGEMRSLLSAAKGDDERTLVIYGDILFDGDALKKILRSDADITLLVDRGYDSRAGGNGKKQDLVKVSERPEKSRRYLDTKGPDRVVKIGKSLSPDEADFEFTGLALFSPAGRELIEETYGELTSLGLRKGFHEAESIEKASLTDVLQELIENDHPVSCIEVTSGWLEIHSFDDYQLACRMAAR